MKTSMLYQDAYITIQKERSVLIKAMLKAITERGLIDARVINRTLIVNNIIRNIQLQILLTTLNKYIKHPHLNIMVSPRTVLYFVLKVIY